MRASDAKEEAEMCDAWSVHACRACTLAVPVPSRNLIAKQNKGRRETQPRQARREGNCCCRESSKQRRSNREQRVACPDAHETLLWTDARSHFSSPGPISVRSKYALSVSPYRHGRCTTHTHTFSLKKNQVTHTLNTHVLLRIS